MATWDEGTVKKAIQDQGWYVTEKEIAHGVQFILTDETCVNCYKTGKVVVQGKATVIRKEAESLFSGAPSHSTATNVTSVQLAPSNTPTFTKSCQDAPLLAVGRNGILVRGFGGQIPPTQQAASF